MSIENTINEMLKNQINCYTFRNIDLETGKDLINIVLQGSDNSQSKNDVILSAIILLLEQLNFKNTTDDQYATQKIILPILNTLGVHISSFQPWLTLSKDNSKYLIVLEEYLKNSIINNHAEVKEIKQYFEEDELDW